MVMDRNNRGHRAKGLPRGVAGTFDATAAPAGVDDVAPPMTDMTPPYGLMDETRKTEWADRFTAGMPADRRDRMRDWYLKEHEYVDLGPGMPPIETKRLPRITRDVWYDDTRPDPAGHDGTRLHDAFVERNMRDNAPDLGWRPDAAGDPYVVSYPGVEAPNPGIGYDRWHARGADDPDRPEHETRHYLDAVRLAAVRDAQELLRARYRKRLESYWNRHSDRVATIGYYADR